jgi:hypothetical protein
MIACISSCYQFVSIQELNVPINGIALPMFTKKAVVCELLTNTELFVEKAARTMPQLKDLVHSYDTSSGRDKWSRYEQLK